MFIIVDLQQSQKDTVPSSIEFSEKANSQDNDQKKKWNCEFCGKKFIRKLFLERHQRVHTGELPFQCGICQKCFSRKWDLKRHFKKHSNYGNPKADTYPLGCLAQYHIG